MNIWLIKIGEHLPIGTEKIKMRTAILADKLLERQHNILWWTSTFNHFDKKWMFKKDTEFTVKDNFKIIALKGLGYKKNFSFSRLIDHRIIASKFRKLALKIAKPDIIIVSTPSYDLAFEAVMFAKKNNIPVLVDIRDKWPDIFLYYVPIRLRKLVKLLLNKEFSMFKQTVQMADGIISMMHTLLEWGLETAGRSRTWKDRVFYLGYKRGLSVSTGTNKISNFIDTLKNKFVITFIGNFGSTNNPAILIECAKKLIRSDIYFVLAGNGEFFEEIKKKSSNMPNIILPGLLNQDEITTLLEFSRVGICTATKFIEMFPNKAFIYLSSGLPIISAFQGDLREIIEKHQIGFYYQPGDMETLVNFIKRLYNDTELYQRMSKNALRLFNEMFDADKIYEEYAKHIEDVVHNYSSSST